MSDRYNLGATTGDKEPTYYIAVVLKGKIDLKDVTASSGEGRPLEIFDKGEEKAMLTTFAWIKISIPRNELLRAAETGMEIKVASRKGGGNFRVEPREFSALVKDADQHDSYSLGAEIAALSKSFEAAMPLPGGVTGKAKITGQAFLKTRGGEVRVGAGNKVTLVPNDSWCRKVFELSLRGASIENLNAAALGFYTKNCPSTESDATGSFEFDNVSPGSYTLETEVTWEVPGTNGMEKTGGRVWKSVSVSEGGTLRVMLTR
jgi:hypothetical protein